MSDELTSLGWLSFISSTNDRDTMAQKGTKKITPSRPSRQNEEEKSIFGPNVAALQSIREYHRRHRPPCSYSCLIAMALMASPTGCLPVNRIYRFIEQEYPFYRTAPEGWKNSVRHNLSMNQNFIKVNSNGTPVSTTSNDSTGTAVVTSNSKHTSSKKGYYWALNPSKSQTLELEVEKTLRTMGRSLIENGPSSNVGQDHHRYVNEAQAMRQESQNSRCYSNSPTPVVQYSLPPHQSNALQHKMLIKNDINTLVLVNLISMCAAAAGTTVNNSTIEHNNQEKPSHNNVEGSSYEEPYKWIGHECVITDDEVTLTDNDSPQYKKRKLQYTDHIYCSHHDTDDHESISSTISSSTISSSMSSISTADSSVHFVPPMTASYGQDTSTNNSSIAEQLLLTSSPSVSSIQQLPSTDCSDLSVESLTVRRRCCHCREAQNYKTESTGEQIATNGILPFATFEAEN